MPGIVRILFVLLYTMRPIIEEITLKGYLMPTKDFPDFLFSIVTLTSE